MELLVDYSYTRIFSMEMLSLAVQHTYCTPAQGWTGKYQAYCTYADQLHCVHTQEALLMHMCVQETLGKNVAIQFLKLGLRPSN